MTGDDPVVTVSRSEGRTRITIETARPGASSVTIDLPVDVVIAGHIRPDPPRRETATATR